MMTCKELIQDFLMDYVQGELGAESRVEFEKHLSVCPSCVRYIDSYRRTIEMARHLGDGPRREGEVAEPPEGLVRAILASVPKRPSA